MHDESALKERLGKDIRESLGCAGHCQNESLVVSCARRIRIEPHEDLVVVETQVY